MGPQRRHDLVRGQVAGRGLVRIDPDAHGIVAGGTAADVAHAGDAQQPVADVDAGIVGDVLLVQGPVGGVEVHRQQRVRRRLADHHADLAHRIRQAGFGRGDAVLHQLLGLVDIDAQLEGHGDRQASVAGGGGRDVVHAVHAVDLLLDRPGHGVGQKLCRGAGIAGRDRHRRRHDLGILRDRQPRIGDGTHQGDQHRHHDREGRSFDEEVGDFHRSAVTARPRHWWRNGRGPAGRGPAAARRRGRAGRWCP